MTVIASDMGGIPAAATTNTVPAAPLWYHWLSISGSIITEVASAYFYKRSQGFCSVAFTLGAFALSNFNAVCTILALSGLELSTGWAIYSAAEVPLSIMLGFVVFGESINLAKLIGIVCCLVGVTVLIIVEASGEMLPRSLTHPLFATTSNHHHTLL